MQAVLLQAGTVWHSNGCTMRVCVCTQRHAGRTDSWCVRACRHTCRHKHRCVQVSASDITPSTCTAKAFGVCNCTAKCQHVLLVLKDQRMSTTTRPAQALFESRPRRRGGCASTTGCQCVSPPPSEGREDATREHTHTGKCGFSTQHGTNTHAGVLGANIANTQHMF